MSAILWQACDVEAIADPAANICQAIAAEADRRGPQLGEQALASLSLALANILPKGMSYLPAKDLSTADFRDLVDCQGCDNLSDETVRWMLDANEDASWYKVMVDTRPWNDLIVVFTFHSMHQRDDALLLLRESNNGKLEVVPSAFGQPDDMCCDRSFELLRVGNQLKIVRPPSYEFFREEESSAESTGYDLTLDIYNDPTKPGQTGGNCAVEYDLNSRLVSDSNFSDSSGTESLLNRELGEMVQEFALAEEKGSVTFPNDVRFVDAKTPVSEVAAVRALLTSQDRPENLTYDAMKVLTADAKPYYADHRDVESRWFAFGNGEHAYAALLMRDGGTAEYPFLALFAVSGGKLLPYAAFELKNIYRFSSARATAID